MFFFWTKANLTHFNNQISMNTTRNRLEHKATKHRICRPCKGMSHLIRLSLYIFYLKAVIHSKQGFNISNQSTKFR
jgi:hypothetical protein